MTFGEQTAFWAGKRSLSIFRKGDRRVLLGCPFSLQGVESAPPVFPGRLRRYPSFPVIGWMAQDDKQEERRKEMLKRLLSKLYRDQRGITGLETAIILIAFVVVAAVFAYTVLSAGLFATQKSSESVYSGLEEAQSTLELRGGMTAYASDPETGDPADGEDVDDNDASDMDNVTSDIVTRLQFTLANVLGGEPIDLTPPYTVASTVDNPPTAITANNPDEHVTVISYQDRNTWFPDCAWTVSWIGQDSSDNLLEEGEKAVITVWLIPHDGTDFNLAASGSTTFFNDDDDAVSPDSTYGGFIGVDHEFTLEVKPPSGAVLTMERTTPSYLDEVMDLH